MLDDIILVVARDATNKKGLNDYMNINKLKGKIVEKEMNVETLAEMIGINRSSLYRKLNNGENITIGEAVRIKDALSMTNAEAYDIFLS